MAEQLDFTTDLYSAVAVERAAEVYGGLARITVTHEPGSVRVAFADVDPDVADVLADELANYVLNETIALHRAPTAVTP